jgi:hypothetical protein
MLPGHAPDDVKERQARKIRELADTLVRAGFASLDAQAHALGLSRSTTWTILKARHKNYGLSAVLIRRVLANPDLDPRVRAKIIEYVREKARGSFGHNGTQLRRFIQVIAGVTTVQGRASESADLDARQPGAPQRGGETRRRFDRRRAGASPRTGREMG